MTEAQATILARMAAGSTLAQSMIGDRLWSLLEDPFTVFNDVSPRVLLADGLIALAQHGSVKADRASTYRLTSAGQAALWKWRLRGR